ncbi:Enoyl-CoA hydratase/isomerase [Pyrobaculum islandicum DSM 4184]|uniref:Enoyl-CoA hydratase/isomerase n=1 Tax=Pyrobaculum islandicum (strain DSM 4184 / JCM 9189 / GEO3) TaxID=384616 RepID=A1RV41_PYRIL|nr:enoyl-CoA hydratase/isomerase family protein [Pyrobaculum islandicum]ABL88823.1 Enoyl-CoA hydratase/isomerase [Pyrobaculum islandicum DSM 4184]
MVRIETVGKYIKVVLTGEKRNVFSLEMINQLMNVSCDRDVLVTNEGPVFSSGLDLSIFLQNKDDVLEYLFKIHRFVKKILSCPGRVIAYVTGDVYGFGVEFLYFTDYVIASSENIKFSLQGINFGVFPPYTIAIGNRLFPIGYLKVMLNREFYTREALSFGIVSEIGSLSIEKLFSPPVYTQEHIKPRRWLLDVVEEAVPYLFKLAEIGTREETRERIRKFLRR